VRLETERSFDGRCVRNIRTKNYRNLIIGFQVTVKNVGDVFLRHSVNLLTMVMVMVAGQALYTGREWECYQATTCRRSLSNRHICQTSNC